MITDSIPWRRRLQKEVKALESALKAYVSRKGSRWQIGSRLHTQIETFFFESSFIVRKLIDSGKLSDELVSKSIKVTCSKRTKARAGDFDRNLPVLYDVSNS